MNRLHTVTNQWFTTLLICLIMLILAGFGANQSFGQNGTENDPSLKFYFGSLHAIDPLHPEASPLTIDENTVSPQVLSEVSIVSGDYDGSTGITTNIKVSAIFYHHTDGTLWKVATTRVDNAGALLPPTPTQVSSESEATELCSAIPALDTHIAYEIPGPDEDCFVNKEDNQWRLVSLSMDHTQPPENFPGRPITPLLFNTSDGTHLGWLAEENGMLMRVQPDLTTIPLIPFRDFVMFHPNPTQSGKLFLNIDGSIHVYDPLGSEAGILANTGYDIPVGPLFGRPIIFQYATDSSRLFFVVSTENSGAALLSIDDNGIVAVLHEPTDAFVPAQASNPVLIGARVVYAYLTNTNPPSKLVSLTKDGIELVTLDTGEFADSFFVRQGAFVSHSGEFVFYNKGNQSGGVSAVAVKADGNDTLLKWDNAMWIGREDQSEQPIGTSQFNLATVFLADGTRNSQDVGGSALVAINAVNPAEPRVAVGRIPDDINSMIISLGVDRYRIATAWHFDTQGGINSDILFFDSATSDSLRRITNTPAINEIALILQ